MSLNPITLWLLIGIGFCLVEVILPTAFVACCMGISALVVAAIAPALSLPLQIAVWMGLSLLFVWLSRRLVRHRAAKQLHATVADTLTTISPGQLGRVCYEGSSWAARCDDPTVEIGPEQRVIVIGRQGTILIVMPEDHLLHP